MHLSVARKNERLFTRKNVLFVLLLLAGSLSLLRDHEHARAHLPSRAVHDDGSPAVQHSPPAAPSVPIRLEAQETPKANESLKAVVTSRWRRLSADTAKRDAVRDAMRHAWEGYAKHAMGFDEVDPIQLRGSNDLGGLGATVLDSLDSLHLMGLTAQFADATEWVRANFHAGEEPGADVNVFETTIRCLGGLLSAYDLSAEPIFLERATSLGDKLLAAFRTASGMGYGWCNLHSGACHTPHWAPGRVYLAEFGSMQLEMAALSRATGNATFSDTAERALLSLFGAPQRPVGKATGLYYSLWNPGDGTPADNRVGMGGGSDSFYEYLLKVWVLGGKTAAVQPYLERWEAAMAAMEAILVQRSTPTGLLYLVDAFGSQWDSPQMQHTMEHLSCFVGGMLVLGSEGEHSARYMKLAVGLAETCVQMYSRQPTGIAPDSVSFGGGLDFAVADGKNILRPETVETLFYLYRKTGEQKYRDQGWTIFQAFEKHCKAKGGYSGLLDVRGLPARQDGKQQSFFLAETLKYLYLLFEDSSALDLDEWVFNTEAHIFKIRPRETSLLFQQEGSRPPGQQIPRSMRRPRLL